jgi:hypothetical protein
MVVIVVIVYIACCYHIGYVNISITASASILSHPTRLRVMLVFCVSGII